MTMYAKVMDLIDIAQSRRNFLRGSMAVAGGLAMVSSVGLGRAFAQELTDLDILQFAMTLEHLEARMYKDMLAANILTGKELQYVTLFGEHEAAHVEALMSTIKSLGTEPVAAQESYSFPAFDSREAILNFAKTAEDIGVGAYQGAAAAIKNKDILAAAGSIVQVEARHAAIINLLLGLQPVPNAVTASQTVDEVLAKVGPILGQ
jgi:rubrerythrin